MGLHKTFTSLIPSLVDSTIWLLICISELKHCFWIYSSYTQPSEIWKVRSESDKTSESPMDRHTSHVICWGPGLDWGQPWILQGPTFSPLPTCSFHSSASCAHTPLGDGVGEERFCGPQKEAILGARKILFPAFICTAGIWTASWTCPGCEALEDADCYHCQIQFPPLPLPLLRPGCPSVYETAKVG